MYFGNLRRDRFQKQKPVTSREKNMYRTALAIILILILARCATIVAPVGGPRDETPPQVVVEESTPNKQVNFQKQRIELTFDEFIVLEDVFNQVVVSPPLQYRPTLSLKGKTLRVDFDSRDTLRSNATYTINFGEAVQDLNEKNPAENLRFVFSTGPYLDSLSVRGRIVDARTGESQKEVLFMLYDNLADTVVRTTRPFYFAKTDTSGTFLIENVRAGTFKGFALKDANLNYKYDQANELIGFPDSLIQVADSTPPVQIRLFGDAQVVRLLDSDVSQYGQVKLTFNQAPKDLLLNFAYQNRQQRVVYEYDRDTVRVWYDLDTPADWELYVSQDTFWRDTVQVRALDRAAFFKNAQLAQLVQSGGNVNFAVNPDKNIEVQFNYPLISFDTAQIRMYEDSTKRVVKPDILLDSLNPRTLTLRYPWKEDVNYQLEMLPSGVRDLYGLLNRDTLLVNYRVQARKSFSTLQLTVDSLDNKEAYVIQLLFGESEVVAQFRVENITTFVQEMKALPPGDYTVQIITDYNKNGRWDTGDYNEKRQPEPIMQRKLETLRANWEVEATVSLGGDG